MPVIQPAHDEHDDEPVLVFMDGAAELQLEPDGTVYRPGDRMPKSMTQHQRVTLQAAGLRFETRHREAVVTPEGRPAELAAADHIDPPAPGPAVVAAVEDVPKDDAPQPRRAAPKREG